jgi:putative membrane protein
MTVPLKRVWLLALLAGLYSVLALLEGRLQQSFVPDIPLGLDAALSAAMALLLAFRINRAYERWWEARTLWGRLVNVSRNLAIKIRQLRRPGSTDLGRARNLIVAFCVSLKDHLRDEADLGDLPGFEDDLTKPHHVPGYVAGKLYDLFQQWRSDDHPMSDTELLVMDAEARMLLEVCGGCEKIRNTPVSISWKIFTSQCILLYLLILPWGLFDDFGIWTVPLTIVIAYLVLAAETIARYVEEPFGVHEDHLDLESITDGIDGTVSEALLKNT